MSRYYSKRNKRKVWRKTYGRPFLIRRAFKLVQMAMINAQGIASIGAISQSASFAHGIAEKAVAIAKCALNTSKAINSLDFNEGFVVTTLSHSALKNDIVHVKPLTGGQS